VSDILYPHKFENKLERTPLCNPLVSLGLAGGFFSSRFPTKTLYAFFLAYMPHALPFSLDHCNDIWQGVHSFSLCNFPQLSAIASLPQHHVLWRPQFLQVTDQLSPPYKTNSCCCTDDDDKCRLQTKGEHVKQHLYCMSSIYSAKREEEHD